MINVNMGISISQILKDLTTLETKLTNITSKKYNINFTSNINTVINEFNTAINSIKNKSVTVKVNTQTSNTVASSAIKASNVTNSSLLPLAVNNTNKNTLSTLTNSSNSNFSNNSNYINASYRVIDDRIGQLGSWAQKLNTSLTMYNDAMSSVGTIKTGFDTLNSGVQKVTSGFRDLLLPSIMLISKTINASVEQMKTSARLNSALLGTQEESKELTKLSREISNETGVSASDIQQMGFEYLSAGGDASLLKDMMKLGAMGVQGGFATDKRAYMRALAQTGNVYGAESMEDYYSIANGIAYMDRTSVMETDKFTSTGVKELINFKLAGLSMNESFAALTTMSKNAGAQGMPQALGQLFSKANRPTKKGQTVMDDLGIDFYKDVSTDALKEKGLIKYVEDLKVKFDTLGDSKNIAIDNMFNNVQANKALKLLMENIDELKNDMKEISEGDDFMEQWKAYEESDYAKYLQMTSRLQNSFAGLGDALMPTFINIGNIIAGIIEKITTFCENNEKLITSIIKGVAIFTVFVAVMFIVTTIVKILSGVFLILVGSVMIVIGIFKLLKLIMSGITAVFSFVSVGSLLLAGVLIYAVYSILHNWEGVWSMMKAGWYLLMLTMSEAFMNGLVGVHNWVKGIEDAMNGLLSFISKAGKELSTFFLAVGNNDVIKFIKPEIAWGSELIGNKLANLDLKVDLTTGLKDKVYDWQDTRNYFAKKFNEEMKQDVGTWEDPIISKIKKGIEKIKKMFEQGEGDGKFDGKAFIESFMGGDDLGDGDFTPGEGIEDLLDDLYGDKDKDLEEHKKLVESMASSLKSLADGYRDAVDMLDKYTKKVINSRSIMKNSNTAKSVVLEWAEVQNKLLNSSGISSELKSYISQMKPNQLAELKAISKLSGAELSEFDKNYQTIIATSQTQAHSNIVNIEVQSDKDDKTYKKFAEDVIKELKRVGVKLA